MAPTMENCEVAQKSEANIASDRNASGSETATRQSCETATRVPSDINPSQSARSTCGRSGLGTESDILSTYVKHTDGDVQSTMYNAFTLSKEIATRANEVAEAAYERDFEVAEAKIVELQKASAAAMEAILHAAAQLDLQIANPVAQIDKTSDLRERDKVASNAKELPHSNIDDREPSKPQQSVEALSPTEGLSINPDAKIREAQAIAQAQAELDELETSPGAVHSKMHTMDNLVTPSKQTYLSNDRDKDLSVHTKKGQRGLRSNGSDEWENETQKKEYIENWLHDPHFPYNCEASTSDMEETSTSPSPSLTQKSHEETGNYHRVKKTKSKNKMFFFRK